MRISDVAKLTGITVRTLHYYDEIGLLKPGEVTDAGYRVYNDADLEVLQQILFFRELDFPLEDIRKIMQNPAYEKEAKQRWGATAAYAEYEKRSARTSDAQQRMLDGEGAMILSEFGRNRSLAPDSAQAQALVKRWQDYITSGYYTCTREILSCLGQMYVGDARFTEHIDQYGEGTAAFMAAAIEVYTR